MACLAAHRRALVSKAAARPALPRVRLAAPRPARDVHVRATQDSSQDFDAFLNSLAEKWEKSDNKPVVVGYAAAAVAALWFTEWLIHLPGLDILLGFPVQLVGVLALPVLAVRYYVDNADFGRDVNKFTDNVAAKLPGLKKD